MKRKPALEISPVVSREHGELFAAKFFEVTDESCAGEDAFGVTRLVLWPGGEDGSPAIERYHAIAAEIRAITFDLTKRHMAETFVAVAKAVLDRERGQ